MESENYQINKLAIMQEQESRAVAKVAEIEKQCSVPVVSFIKSNYGFVKLRNRKTEPEIRILIGIAMIKSAVFLGFKGIDDINKPDIVNAILNQYSDLTLEEIYKAFELERYNLYDTKTEHFQLFNADYVTAILKKYRAYKNIIQIQHNIATTPKQLKESISEDEKTYIMENGVNRLFSEFKQNGKIEENGTHIFDYLIERGLIKNNGKPEIVSYYDSKIEEAKEQLKTELTEKNSQRIYPDKNFSSDLKKIASGKSNEIITRAKKNILIEFFKKQVELEKTTIF